MKTSVICNLQDSSPAWENICHNVPQANASWSLKAKEKNSARKNSKCFFLSLFLFSCFASKLPLWWQI